MTYPPERWAAAIVACIFSPEPDDYDHWITIRRRILQKLAEELGLDPDSGDVDEELDRLIDSIKSRRGIERWVEPSS